MEQLSESNFLVFAMNHFEVPTCLDLEEFNDEIKRFRYISRAFKLETINTQLVLNHIIILYNMFGNAATKMLLFKVDKKHWHQLVPFLIYLNRLDMNQIDDIMLTVILDEKVVNDLRSL